jgi:lipoyltransferase 1
MLSRKILNNFKINKRYFTTTLTQNQNLKSLSNLFRHLNDSILLNDDKKSGGSLAIVSLSKDIYVNLALENYIAESINLKNQNVMLLWISEPCIVFGRHQNPWIECNAREAILNQVKLARRYSGGGCVYHDLGNLNISFICDRLKYDRKFNLNLIKNSIESNFKLKHNIELNVSPRYDIFLNVANESMFKVSGSASRLAKNFSYHHCTLLYDADMKNMKLLKSNLIDKITTKATPSVRSKVINLKEFFTTDMNKLIEILCQQYWKHNSNKWLIDHLFEYVNPEEPGLIDLFENDLNELKSWDYIFGHTPKFSLNIKLIDHILNFKVENGLIKDYELKADSNQIDLSLKNSLDLLINSRLCANDLLDKLKNSNQCNNLNELSNFINKNLS